MIKVSQISVGKFQRLITFCNLIALLGTGPAWAQTTDVAGTYYSGNNGFENWSIVQLSADGTFTYSYGVGGCQGIVKGSFMVVGSRISFTNDKEYLSGQSNQPTSSDSLTVFVGTPVYPDLSLTDWRIGKRFIKPLDTVDAGCIRESSKHRRRKKPPTRG
ncbi:hypothetical protein RT717_03770 [Imperialibacter roseus]|uniref:Uncharacterized protein n=1 Tax=Imperialibacter roseus TaxID=1324217 RepID=A0ABZ0ISL3_9BACT|nr:hypothetical protein [Imperialibacter roseus]WOK07741.1 hypothetical protein RT717_03770 [Imperialibacter roseus]